MQFKQSPDVAWNFLGEEIIAFNLKGEREFHQLNSSAALIFRTLEFGCDIDELVSVLMSEFEVDSPTAKVDAQDCLRELQEKRLIVAESP